MVASQARGPEFNPPEPRTKARFSGTPLSSQHPEEYLISITHAPMNTLTEVHTLERCLHFTLLWEQIGLHITYLTLWFETDINWTSGDLLCVTSLGQVSLYAYIKFHLPLQGDPSALKSFVMATGLCMVLTWAEITSALFEQGSHRSPM